MQVLKNINLKPPLKVLAVFNISVVIFIFSFGEFSIALQTSPYPVKGIEAGFSFGAVLRPPWITLLSRQRLPANSSILLDTLRAIVRLQARLAPAVSS